MKKRLTIWFLFLLAVACNSCAEKNVANSNSSIRTISEKNTNTIEREKNRLADKIAEQRRKNAELKKKIDTAKKDQKKLEKQVKKTDEDIKKTRKKIDRSDPKTFPPNL